MYKCICHAVTDGDVDQYHLIGTKCGKCLECPMGKKSQDVTQHLRLGYKFDNKMYLEAGPMTDGYSFETGYKFKMDNLVIKGKFEGADSDKRDYIKSQLETEIRYTF